LALKGERGFMELAKRSAHKENSKEWWDEIYSSSGDQYFYSKEPSKFLLDYLKLLPQGAKILDIACGEGRNAVALAEKGYAVTAIDSSDVALERANEFAKKSKVKINFISKDLAFFIPDLMAFDAIISIDFKPPVTLIKNLSRGIKQHGHIFIEAYLMEAAKEKKNLEAFECYKPNELLKSVPQASLQIEYYSELSPAKWGEKVFLIAKKSQFL